MSSPIQLKDHLVFRTIKVLDLGYITIIYFIMGFSLAIIFDRVMGQFDEDDADKKSTIRIALELILHVWFIGTIGYIVRNLTELIGSPLDGISGFDHSRVKELGNASVFTLIFIFFQNHFRSKLQYLYNRINPVSPMLTLKSKSKSKSKSNVDDRSTISVNVDMD
jgi:hypothetical protein